MKYSKSFLVIIVIFLTIKIIEFYFTSRLFSSNFCSIRSNVLCSDPKVTFHLYTSSNLHISRKLFAVKDDSYVKSIFNSSKPTKIIVHGYNSDMNLDSLVNIRTEYLKKGSYNVIAVDWQQLAAGPFYPLAVKNLSYVGKILAEMIKKLVKYGAKDIHVIGFSLGAHIPAYAAKYLEPYKISRISGLDPAMPLFVTVNNDKKLDPSDAEFVDVIHTNAFVQGKCEPSGHVDFYMNGGFYQPGCFDKDFFGCNHQRAAIYFAESINSKIGFWGWSCSGFLKYSLGFCSPKLPKIQAGEHVNKTVRGSFVVKTNANSPFAKGISKI